MFFFNVNNDINFFILILNKIKSMKNTIKNKILNSTKNTHYNSKLTKGAHYMFQLLFLLFSFLILIIYFIYKKLFLQRNKLIKILSIFLILIVIFLFYFYFKNLIEMAFGFLLFFVSIIYCEIYNFFTGENISAWTFAMMPTISMIINLL